MKFFAVIALALASSVVAQQRDPAVVAAVAARPLTEVYDSFPPGEGALTKRACTASKCDCDGFGPGLFCGDGILGCKSGHVYECNKNGHTTCDYGVRKSCQKCGQLSC